MKEHFNLSQNISEGKKQIPNVYFWWILYCVTSKKIAVNPLRYFLSQYVSCFNLNVYERDRERDAYQESESVVRNNNSIE